MLSRSYAYITHCLETFIAFTLAGITLGAVITLFVGGYLLLYGLTLAIPLLVVYEVFHLLGIV